MPPRASSPSRGGPTHENSGSRARPLPAQRPLISAAHSAAAGGSSSANSGCTPACVTSQPSVAAAAWGQPCFARIASAAALSRSASASIRHSWLPTRTTSSVSAASSAVSRLASTSALRSRRSPTWISRPEHLRRPLPSITPTARSSEKRASARAWTSPITTSIARIVWFVCSLCGNRKPPLDAVSDQLAWPCLHQPPRVRERTAEREQRIHARAEQRRALGRVRVARNEMREPHVDQVAGRHLRLRSVMAQQRRHRDLRERACRELFSEQPAAGSEHARGALGVGQHDGVAARAQLARSVERAGQARERRLQQDPARAGGTHCYLLERAGIEAGDHVRPNLSPLSHVER